MNRIPDEELEQRLVVTVIAGWRRLVPERQLPQTLVDRAQDLVPDPVRVDGRVVQLGARGRHLADRVVDLRDGGGYDEVEEEPDRGEEREVVDDDADGSVARGARR